MPRAGLSILIKESLCDLVSLQLAIHKHIYIHIFLPNFLVDDLQKYLTYGVSVFHLFSYPCAKAL